MKSPGYIIVTYKFSKEGYNWTANCVELGTVTFARSLQEAQKRLSEAVLRQINTLEEVGEIERFFRENKIKFYHDRPSTKEVSIKAPLNRATFVQPHIQSLMMEVRA